MMNKFSEKFKIQMGNKLDLFIWSFQVIFFLSIMGGPSFSPARHSSANDPGGGGGGTASNLNGEIADINGGVSPSDELLEEDKDGQNDSNSSLKMEDSEPAEIGLFENSEQLNLPSFISKAKKTIEIEIYELGDDAVVNAIKEAINRKVRVRIVVESSPVGKKACWLQDSIDPKQPSCKELKELETSLKSANDRILKSVQMKEEKWKELNSLRPFKKEALCGMNSKGAVKGRCFQHGKIVIIDRKLALLSTGNFNSSNLCDLSEPTEPSNCNRDYSYITRDPSVLKAMLAIFEADLAGERPNIPLILKETKTGKKLTISPYSYLPLVDLINSAKHSIQIQTQYLKSDSFLNALISKARTEKTQRTPQPFVFQILLSDPCHFSKLSKKEKKKLKELLSKLQKENISVRFMTHKQKIKSKPAYLHAKAIVADENVAWVGSTNISDSSFFINREYGIIFRYPKRVRNLVKIMKQDFEDPGSVDWEQGLLCQR